MPTLDLSGLLFLSLLVSLLFPDNTTNTLRRSETSGIGSPGKGTQPKHSIATFAGFGLPFSACLSCRNSFSKAAPQSLFRLERFFGAAPSSLASARPSEPHAFQTSSGLSRVARPPNFIPQQHSTHLTARPENPRANPAHASHGRNSSARPGCSCLKPDAEAIAWRLLRSWCRVWSSPMSQRSSVSQRLRKLAESPPLPLALHLPITWLGFYHHRRSHQSMPFKDFFCSPAFTLLLLLVGIIALGPLGAKALFIEETSGAGQIHLFVRDLKSNR